jgi:hypothetical protein
MRAANREVFPAPGGPDTINDEVTRIVRSRNDAALGVSESSATKESSDSRRSA